PPPPPAPEPEPARASDWQPAPADGQWLPPGAPGSNWVSGVNGATTEYVGRRRAPDPGDDVPPPVAEPSVSAPPEPRRGRHSAPADSGDPGRPVHQAPPPEPPEPAPAPERRRHRSADDTDTAGQSVAELLARLQASPTPGGRRRRREE
ncbi:DUF6779 domain-containing protein, partial [Mycolicibacterium celeriflavum]